MKHQEIAKVLENKKVAPEHYRITLAAPRISRESLPGQFVMVKAGNGSDPLLRRPLSFNRIDGAKGTIDILFKVVGRATRSLSEIEPGEDLDIIGPLGNGFNLDTSKDLAILVGGGAGAAPLLSLAKALKTKVKAVYALLGANNINSVLCEDDFKALGAETLVSTDDGTYGIKGLITDILLDVIGSKLSPINSCIYACGPRPMVKALESISTQYKIPCQVSLEEWMACGFGSCNGCVVSTKSGYKKVCSDGPVFNAGELLWQR
ncbi:MAG: dihydroorotate dehydrogenase electron transfer subunit [bacterium]